MKIYISGPYSTNQVEGTRNAIIAAEQVRKNGHLPFVPHLSLLWDLVCPSPYEEWMNYDMEWLEQCDAILRLPGESNGADIEVQMAVALGKIVYTNIEEIPPCLTTQKRL